MGELSQWVWLAIAVVAVGGWWLVIDIIHKSHTYEPIPPDVQFKRHGPYGRGSVWSCPSCGKHNYPSEWARAGRWVRGVCSCGRIWDGKYKGPKRKY